MFRFKRPFFHFGSGCLLTDEAVNENSHRSSRKQYPRLPLYVPDVFESVSALQRDVRAGQTSKTFAKLLA